MPLRNPRLKRRRDPLASAPGRRRLRANKAGDPASAPAQAKIGRVNLEGRVVDHLTGQPVTDYALELAPRIPRSREKPHGDSVGTIGLASSGAV